jgi:hypothetical protein
MIREEKKTNNTEDARGYLDDNSGEKDVKSDRRTYKGGVNLNYTKVQLVRAHIS